MIAKSLVKAGLARRILVQLSYAIGGEWMNSKPDSGR